MAIIDVVKMDFESDEFVKKFGVTDKTPEGSMELSTWTQLIVSESQEAVLLRQGALDGPFGPGRHVLKTENIPVIGKVLNLPFGRSPFTAEVWYINRAMSLDVKWGTPDPIKLSDPKYDILIPVSARGQFGIQIQDTRKFFIKLVGTLKSFNKEDIRNYFKGMVLTVSKTVLAKQIIERQISVLEIATDLLYLSEKIEEELQGRLSEFGLKLVNFFIDTIDVVDDQDESIKTLRSALAKRAEMKIVGYNYQQERSLNILETAAANEGPSSGLMGASMGLGMGVGVGNVMGQMMGDVLPHASVAPAQAPAPASAASAMTMDEKISSIRKFAELKEAGLLTEEEFQAQKTKILNS